MGKKPLTEVGQTKEERPPNRGSTKQVEESPMWQSHIIRLCRGQYS